MRSGARLADSAVVDMWYIGSYGLAAKREITCRGDAFLTTELALDPEKLIVLFAEMVSKHLGRRRGECQ